MPLRAFSIANLASHAVLPQFAEPWFTAPAVPAFESRQAYQKWLADSNSTVPLFNLIEGENPTLRVSATNPPHKVHGIVVDYDTPVSATELSAGIARSPVPIFAYNQTRRKGVRLVYAFERPIFYYGKDTFKRLMSRAKKELNLAGLFPGLDVELLSDPDHTYTAGDNWTVNSSAHISSATLGLWLFEALNKSDDFSSGIEVPLDVVEKAVHTKFPGRWTGPFTEGARGIRFWAPEADNPTAAIVRKTGMTAFTGDRPFMSWSDIFGRAFIQQYQEDRIGRAVAELYANQVNQYYRKLPEGTWNLCDQTVMKRHLRVAYALSDKTDKETSVSEVERVLHHLEMNKRVEGAMPFPHNRDQIVHWNGKTFLNLATTLKLVQPQTNPADWACDFPFLSDYLTTLFYDQQNLTVFLAWLKVWYEGCRAGRPTRGHAMFIAGPTGTGKSFLSLEVLASIFGGYANMQKFFVNDNQYNDASFQKALWALDDQTILGDRKKHQKFSGLVKACVANPSMPYEMKYGYAGEAPFSGRVVVTLNEDPISIGILPDTDQSMLDKAILLRTSDNKATVFADTEKNHEVVMSELPAFLRWLVDWEIPAEFVSRDDRFGIVAWHDRAILNEARSASESETVMQAVEIWIRDYTPEKKGEPWTGSTSELLGLMLNHDAARGLVRTFNPVTFGRHLSAAVAAGSSWISRKTRRGRALFSIQKPEDSD